MWQITSLDAGVFLGDDLHLLESVEFNHRIKHIVEIVGEVSWHGIDPDMLTRFVCFLLLLLVIFFVIYMLKPAYTVWAHIVIWGIILLRLLCSYPFACCFLGSRTCTRYWLCWFWYFFLIGNCLFKFDMGPNFCFYSRYNAVLFNILFLG